MTLADFLSSHARGHGKTHKLALLIKKLDGTLIVRNEAEAYRVRETYGINAFPFSIDPERLRGKALGITYVDPDAVGLWIHKLENENRDLRAALEKIMATIRETQE